MEANTLKFQCPFCKNKMIFNPQDLSTHFIQNHSNISPEKMTEWFIKKANSKINKKINKINKYKGYDKKLRNSRSKKWVKVIYTPMGNSS